MNVTHSAIGLALVLGGCVSSAPARESATSATPNVSELGSDLEPFRVGFDAGRGRFKLVAILSPT